MYGLLYRIDVKFGWAKHYSYETAPFCGHHFNGHKGKLTSSQYHEGMGAAETRSLFGFSIINHSDEGCFVWKKRKSSKKY